MQVYTWGRGTSGRLGQFGDRAGYKGDPMKFSPGLVRCDWRSYVMQEDQSEPVFYASNWCTRIR
jgi:hypothetical protein